MLRRRVKRLPKRRDALHAQTIEALLVIFWGRLVAWWRNPISGSAGTARIGFQRSTAGRRVGERSHDSRGWKEKARRRLAHER